MKIQLNLITNPKNVLRQEADGLEELAQSIKEHGVIVPIKVRQVDGKYEIVYGHRRVLASRMVGLTEIDATVEGLEDTEALLQSIIENIQREDLSDVEEGQAFAAIREQTGWSGEEIGKSIGRDRSYVNKRLILLDPGPIHDALGAAPRQVPDAAEKAQFIRRLDSSAQGVVAKKVAKEELSARQTERLVSEVQRQQKFAGGKGIQRVLATPYEELGLQAPTEAKREAVAKAKSSDKPSNWDTIQTCLKAIGDYLTLLGMSRESRKANSDKILKVRNALQKLVDRADGMMEGK